MEHVTGENNPLLTPAKSRYKLKVQTRCCVKSKAAIFILIWNLLVAIAHKSFIDPSFYTSNLYLTGHVNIIINLSTFGLSAIILLFYPLAGYLADVRWGRYKTVVNSLRCSFWVFIPIFIISTYVAVSATQNTVNKETLIILSVPVILFSLLFLASLVAFSANIIQFGIDQLRDLPSEESVLYIHWYVWTAYTGATLQHIASSLQLQSITVIILTTSITGVAFILLGLSLCIQKHKRRWFFDESGSRNPYKLVFSVIKFALKHKNPLRRSAFTYCEDELPSRLDLGKEKYGGPFTTEQVEDVKAFLGILRVLLALGPIFAVDIAANEQLPNFAQHMDKQITGIMRIFKNGTIFYLLVAIIIPLYIFLLRPCVHNRVLGMFERIKLGILLILASAICILLMDIVGHINSSSTACFLAADYTPSSNCSTLNFTCKSLNLNISYLAIPYTLNAFAYTFLYIGAYQFILAQSPHAMKGLLIGTFFAIKGVFKLLGVLTVYLPFISWSSDSSFPSCGFIYYLINIAVALTGIVAYTCITRSYQYRERDEPDNIYRYAEEYYAKAQDEPNYDYDDYDNLNVHSIK